MAVAQLSGSLAVLSDYRFRGRTLSDNGPTAQLTLNYDRDDGWYAGAMAARAKLEDSPGAQLVAYGGYAQRLPGGIGWEAGATQTVFTGSGAANYFEGYAGVSREQVNARLYYSPRYFGSATRTVYFEANGFLRLGETLRLVGHAGLLRSLGGDSAGTMRGQRHDYRLGLAAQVGEVDLQLARVTGITRRYPAYGGYPAYAGPRPRAFVLSAAYSF
jgi:uncharacterized protein (TIGR02001 family)